MPSQKFGAGNLFRNQRAVSELKIAATDTPDRHKYAPDMTGDMEMTKPQLEGLINLFKSGDTEISKRTATTGEKVIKVSIAGRKYNGAKAGDYLAVWLEEKWKPEKKKEETVVFEEVTEVLNDDMPF